MRIDDGFRIAYRALETRMKVLADADGAPGLGSWTRRSPALPPTRSVALQTLVASYDMDQHTRGAQQASGIADAFTDAYAVALGEARDAAGNVRLVHVSSRWC